MLLDYKTNYITFEIDNKTITCMFEIDYKNYNQEDEKIVAIRQPEFNIAMTDFQTTTPIEEFWNFFWETLLEYSKDKILDKILGSIKTSNHFIINK